MHPPISPSRSTGATPSDFASGLPLRGSFTCRPADGEPLARERVRQLLQAEPDIVIVRECAAGTETVKAVQNESPHLVLPDVRMPDLDGFEVIRELGADRMPIIIFVTAHDQFALRAFEARAADYLLKPLDRERFQEALRRARSAAKRGKESSSIEEILGVFATLKERSKSAGRFAIKSGGTDTPREAG